MYYSRERQGRLAELVVAALGREKGLLFEEDPISTRRFLVRLLAECGKADDALRLEAEKKVAALRRRVPEGSAEWEVLVRNNMSAEHDRLQRYRVPLDRI
jgi:hypothetical protein